LFYNLEELVTHQELGFSFI